MPVYRRAWCKLVGPIAIDRTRRIARIRLHSRASRDARGHRNHLGTDRKGRTPLSWTQTLDARRAGTFGCALMARAAFRAPADAIAGLRKAPDEPGGFSVHPSLLRHADEQTVAGLAAVYRAIRLARLDPDGFADWSVLAAPRYLGRAAFERAFPTFRDEGAWGVSPHLIPAHSLHSPSGTISQALKAHGPNLGIGGTPGGAREALLCAATWLGSGIAPGVWVVLTGRVDQSDGTADAGDYEALALALAPEGAAADAPILHVSPEGVDLAAFGDDSSPSLARWLAPGTLRLDAPPAASTIPRPHFRIPAKRVERP